MTKVATRSPDKVYMHGVEYSLKSHVQFIRDMKKLGLPIELRVRYMYAGPCVRVTDRKKLEGQTSVRCAYENKKMHFLVFPAESDPIVMSIAKDQGLT